VSGEHEDPEGTDAVPGTQRPPGAARPGKAVSSPIPELRELILRYGERLTSDPPYVIIGEYRSEAIGRVMGILAAASNELYAYLLRREVNRHGTAAVERTEYHPDGGTFSLERFRQRLRDRRRE